MFRCHTAPQMVIQGEIYWPSKGCVVRYFESNIEMCDYPSLILHLVSLVTEAHTLCYNICLTVVFLLQLCKSSFNLTKAAVLLKHFSL